MITQSFKKLLVLSKHKDLLQQATKTPKGVFSLSTHTPLHTVAKSLQGITKHSNKNNMEELQTNVCISTLLPA